MKNCKAAWARCPYCLPLALGKHPRGVGVNPPLAVLYILAVLTKHPNKKPCPCLPVPNSFFYL